MSTTYRSVSWNPQKRRYDLVAGGLILAFAGIVLGAQAMLRPELTIETLLIRTIGATAFTLLTVILCIGPLARLDRRFLPLLYNRRHLGVMMFTLAFGHGIFSIVQFHALGTLDPIVSVFVSNARYTDLRAIPFQPFGLAALVILFLMAATSHDFWLHNLTAPAWKALHMSVYLA
jgi:DMSO/TMAO reductase YedYZ heme-binding membrane subunit